MSQPTGGPAFPIEGTHHGEVEWHHGMSLRDWFAGMALQGLLQEELHPELHAQEFAQAAYQLADAMLQQREADHA